MGGCHNIHAARSQIDLARMLADRGKIVRRWESEVCNVDWSVVRPRKLTRGAISMTENKAMRKLAQIPELRSLFEQLTNF